MIHRTIDFFVGKASAATFDFFRLIDPVGTNTGVADAQSAFSRVVGNVITWVLAIVALIAFIYLIISGVNYITAGGDAEKATKARTGILNAIIGIIVVVISYFILSFAIRAGAQIVR